ncbi:MAG: indolepyruvate oxidoreductase subunit beta [Candidatus Lernaella stagnicola]|nr:indolepyruvate oxidoreductase subunit beta [Candidatus Lernaella stagnicola]
MNPDKTTRVYLCGVGGQGSLTASRLLGEAAMAADLPVTVSEVHGMSQRGGIVESAVLIGGAKSPLVGRGDADVLMAFEPLEALRALPYCGGKTVAVVNTRAIVPFTVTLGHGEYPDRDDILEQVAAVCRRLISFDATTLAEQAGNAMAANAVMLGAVAATGALPMSVEVIERIVTEGVPAKFRATNQQAFNLGKAAAAGG